MTKPSGLQATAENTLDRLKAELAIVQERHSEHGGTDWCDGYIDGLKRAIELLEDSED